MQACDRHGRNDGSLRTPRYTFDVRDLEDCDETPMGPVPRCVFDWAFCPSCFEDFKGWVKDSEPESLYLVEPAEPKPDPVIEDLVDVEEGAEG